MKIKFIWLYLFIIIMIFSACSTQADNGLKSGTTGQIDSRYEEQNSTNSILYYYGVNTHSNRDMDFNGIFNEISLITENVLGFSVKFDFDMPVDYLKLLSQRINSGDQVDVFDFLPAPDHITMDIVSQYKLADCTDLLSMYYPASQKLLDMHPEIMDSYVVDNKLYVAPGYISSARSNLYAIIIDRTLQDKIGLTEINDFSEFLEVYTECIGKGLVKGDNVFYCDIDSFIRLYLKCYGYFYVEFGIFYDPKSKEIVPMENTPEFIEAYLMYQNMYQDGYVREFPVDTNNLPPVNSLDAVLENRYPIYPSKYLNMVASCILGYKQFDERYVLHTLNADESFYMSYRIAPYGVTDHGKVKEALQFINLINTHQEVYDLLRYGQKDTNYILAGEKVEFTPDVVIGYNWRSSVFYNPDLERQFAYEDNDNYSIRINNKANTPFSYQKYLESLLYIGGRPEGLDYALFIAIRSLSEYGIGLKKSELYEKIKNDLPVEEFIKLIWCSDMQEFIDIFKSFLIE